MHSEHASPDLIRETSEAARAVTDNVERYGILGTVSTKAWSRFLPLSWKFCAVVVVLKEGHHTMTFSGGSTEHPKIHDIENMIIRLLVFC